MIVIVCIDDEFGMLFNKSRQSMDCILTEDILKTVGDKRLLIDKFSKTLFLRDSAQGDGTAQTDGSFSGDGMPLCESVCKNLVVSENLLSDAADGDFCFVEDKEIKPYIQKIEQLIIYKWNRSYPSDFKLDVSLLEGFHLKSTTDFKGNSHEKITKEVYVR